MTGKLSRRKTEEKREYTLGAMAIEEVGFQTMKEYIRRQQNTFAWYIYTRSLIYLCEGSERAPGSRVGMRWWEQASINLAGAREEA